MFSDATKTIKAQLYDRIGSPLFSSFAFSWVVWNYKFIIIVFSTTPAMEKIDYIQKTIYPDIYSSSIIGVVGPLITTLLIIFIYPIPARYVYAHHKSQEKKLRSIQQDIDDLNTITIEEKLTIISSIEEQKEYYNKYISNLIDENNKLKDEINKLKKSNPSIDYNQVLFTDDVQKLSLKILVMISNSESGLKSVALENKIDLNKIKLKSLINDLKSKGLIDIINRGGSVRYIATDIGNQTALTVIDEGLVS